MCYITMDESPREGFREVEWAGKAEKKDKASTSVYHFFRWIRKRYPLLIYEYKRKKNTLLLGRCFLLNLEQTATSLWKIKNEPLSPGRCSPDPEYGLIYCFDILYKVSRSRAIIGKHKRRLCLSSSFSTQELFFSYKQWSFRLKIHTYNSLF